MTYIVGMIFLRVPLFTLYVFCSILFASVTFPQHASATNTPPNILFIMCDDLGYGDLGVLYQNLRLAANDRTEPWHLTPQLDAIAGEGMLMTHHYCPAPVCAPSRASFLLGVTQGHSNIRNNQFDSALENNHTVATVMKEAGYATALVGKYGLQGSGGTAAAWPAYPTKRGFDYYYGYVRHGDGHRHYPVEDNKQVWENDNEVSAGLELCYTTDLFTARAKQWIIDHRTATPEQPFFMFLAYDTPHAILQFPPSAFPSGGGLNGGVQWLGTPGSMINTATGSKDSYSHPDYSGGTYDDDDDPNTPEVTWPAVYKRYATSVRRIDDCVGDLTQLLRDLNIDDNTLLVFTSDNGPSKEDYLSFAVNYAPNFFDNFGPFDGIKRDVWEGGIRMPLVAWMPGTIPAGSVNSHASAFWDWLPTFAELGGIPAPARSDGVSLMPTLRGMSGQPPSQIYIEYQHTNPTPNYGEFEAGHAGTNRGEMQTIRIGDYMGVRVGIASHADDFRIYNVYQDPKQVFDLGQNAAYATLQQKMKDTVLQSRRPKGNAARPYDDEHIPPTLNPGSTTPGIRWAAYPGTFAYVPATRDLVPDQTGTALSPDLSVLPQNDNIAIAFSGFIEAPTNGTYTFELTCDAGAHLRLHRATLIDADFGYGGGTRSEEIHLQQGLHPFTLTYARGSGGSPSLDLNWSGPGFATLTSLAGSVFRSGSAISTAPTANPDHTSTPLNASVIIPALTNDTDDGTPQALKILATTAPHNGTVSNAISHLIYTPATNFLGRDAFSYTISDGQLTSTSTVEVTVDFASPAALWLPFDEPDGSTVYDAGGQRIGTMTNIADTAAARVPGRFNRAISFDGDNDHLVLLNNFTPPFHVMDRTTAAWIKTSGPGAIIAWGRNANFIKWYMRVENAAAKPGVLRVETGGGSIRGSTDLRDGNWHHVAAVFSNDGSANVEDVILYVDGQVETINSVSPGLINTQLDQVTIGRDRQNRHFNGTIDEVRIYHRALSAAEIAILAQSTQDSALAWHRRYYGDTAIAWNSDDDQDNQSRLTEYAFGGTPHRADSGNPLTITSSAPGEANLQGILRIPGSHELSYSLLRSSSLNGPWVLSPLIPGVTPLDPNWEQQDFTVPLTDERTYWKFEAKLTAP